MCCTTGRSSWLFLSSAISGANLLSWSRVFSVVYEDFMIVCDKVVLYVVLFVVWFRVWVWGACVAMISLFDGMLWFV